MLDYRHDTRDRGQFHGLPRDRSHTGRLQFEILVRRSGLSFWRTPQQLRGARNLLRMVHPRQLRSERNAQRCPLLSDSR